MVYNPIFEFYKIDENGCAVTLAKGCTCKTLKVPAFSPDRLRVTKILDYAFLNNTELESVILPSTLNSVGDSAFENCTSLKTVSLPSSLQYIGMRGFKNCLNLENVILPENLRVVASEAFSGCVKLAAVEIPDSLGYMDNAVFSGCFNLSVRCHSYDQSLNWAPAWATLIGEVVYDDMERIEFGEYPVYKSLVTIYNRALHSIKFSPETLKHRDISTLKGLFNRCIKKDQMDWITSYHILGEPSTEELQELVDDSLVLRNELRNSDFSNVKSYYEKHKEILDRVYAAFSL